MTLDALTEAAIIIHPRNVENAPFNFTESKQRYLASMINVEVINLGTGAKLKMSHQADLSKLISF